MNALDGIDVVVLDWSGVISDDFDKVVSTFNKVVQSFGHEPLDVDRFRELSDLTTVDLYREIGITDIPKEEIDRRYKRFFEESELRTKAFPDVKEVLEYLKRRDRKIAVCSAHLREFIEKEAKEYGISEYLSIIRGRGLKKKDALEEIMKYFGVNGNRTLFVGDMVSDIVSGREAGVHTAVVLTGYQSRQVLSKQNPEYILENLSGLYEGKE